MVVFHVRASVVACIYEYAFISTSGSHTLSWAHNSAICVVCLGRSEEKGEKEKESRDKKKEDQKKQKKKRKQRRDNSLLYVSEREEGCC